MNKEKTIWVKPLFFKEEVKVHIDDVIISLNKAMKEDDEIRYMNSVSDFMHDLYVQARRDRFKFETLEEERLLQQFIHFMECKRKGITCLLHLEVK